MSRLKKLIMMANQIDDKPSLPSHLERADYLEATGTQYIDLGYPLGYNNKVIVDIWAASAYYNNGIFGNSINSTRRFSASTGTSSSSCNFESVTQNTAKHQYKRQLWTIDKSGIVVDENRYNWSATPTDFTTDGNVYLCALNTSSGVNYYYKGKIYSCQIYENDVLIHDYIPCFNTENRRPCMYDTITGIELYNQGTGEFNYHIEGKPIPYLAFEALEDDLQVSITKSATQYSLDRVTWIDLSAEEMTPPIAKGEKVWFKANITPDGTSSGIGTFSCTKQCNLEGTPMSLLYGDRASDVLNLSKPYSFAYLFSKNENIIRVNNPMEFLPALTLSAYSYYAMFSRCSNLQNGVYLPTVLLNGLYVYAYMYMYCTSLTETFDFPEWIAVTGGFNCYYMYSRCISLKKQPKITTKANITDSGVFWSMFECCTGLEEAPPCTFKNNAIRITQSMYKGCTSLKSASQIDLNAYYGFALSNVFTDCVNLVEPPYEIRGTESGSENYATFQNCISLRKSPIIRIDNPSTKLARMFDGCINLRYITALFITPPSITDWVKSVASKGTIVLNKNIEWNPDDYRGVSGIPAGWEVKYCDPDNLDDIRDYREIDKAWDADTQVVNNILESVITGEQLDDMDSLLQQISQSQEDMSSINTQLENIINT